MGYAEEIDGLETLDTVVAGRGHVSGNDAPAFEALFTGGGFLQMLEEAGRGEELQALTEGTEAFEQQTIEQDLAKQARRLDTLVRQQRASVGQGARGTDQFPNTGPTIQNFRGLGFLEHEET